MGEQKKAEGPRPYLGVQFECCGVYTRIYRDPEATTYEGRCPKCLRMLSVKVDPKEGINQKIFRAR